MLALEPKTLFVGQSVKYDGQAMHPTFEGVPMDRRIEFPVAEDLQMGYCTGLALEGFIPVSIYPRIDFLVLALNQLVSHLDKFPIMADVRPKVIIRTAVGSPQPLDPGPQHRQNHVDALRLMLKTVLVIDLEDEESVLAGYELAMRHTGSALVVEHRSKFDS